MPNAEAKYNPTKKGYEVFVPERDEIAPSSSGKTMLHASESIQFAGKGNKQLRAQVNITEKI